MKKLLIMLVMVLGLTTAMSARDTYAHDASVLPQAARTTIANNFKAKVSVVKIDKTLGHIKEYEVVLTDGNEISFDNKGNWENVETSNTTSVPNGFVPEAIRKYVAKNQKGARIVGIERERNGYDVELSNGIDMKFNNAGQFLRYDD